MADLKGSQRSGSRPSTAPRWRATCAGSVRAALLATALFLLAGGRALAEEQVVETAHYRVHVHGTAEQADEAARVLEAAWRGFEAYFGAAPDLADGERLTVRLLEGRAAFEAAIRADGAQPPAGAGGYYAPGPRTAYLFRQPTVYFTRTLLVHEAAHQFHYLACTRNRNPSAAWYTEGVAEYLSWHRWDGAELALGVVPGVTLKDYPAAALQEATAPAFDLGAVVASDAEPSRPLAWALYRYLAAGGKGGKPVRRFATFRRKMDAGGSAPGLFKKWIGAPRRVQRDFVAWLRTQQATWAPVFNEWEQIGEDAFRGHARVVSACRTKAPAARIAADLQVPAEAWWRGGLLLHFTDATDYTVALLDAGGGVRVHRRRGGAWERIHEGTGPRAGGAGTHRLEAERKGNKTVWRVDGEEIGAWDLPPGPLGLALERSDLRFRSVVVR